MPDASYSWGKRRSREIIESFQNIIDVCNKETVKLLLIAGDLFHRQPKVRDLKEVNYLFEQLEDTRVVIIAGNHDYIAPRSNYTNFKFAKNVYLLQSDKMEHICLDELNTDIYGFSYHCRDITEPKYNNVTIENRDRINILLAHGGDEKNIPINKGRLKELSFDYIALGHIHKPEKINDHIAYSGSLEPLDVNETGPRGYILGDVDKQECIFQFVKSSKREYIHLRLLSTPTMTNGALFQLAKSEIIKQGIENIYKIIIEGTKDNEICYDTELLKDLGNIYEVLDETVYDYDFDQLYEDNKDNMIGLYIDSICNTLEDDEIIRKSLYYGVEALLKTKE